MQKLLASMRAHPDGAGPGAARLVHDRNWIDPAPAASGNDRRAAADRAMASAANAAFPGAVERRVVRRAENLWRQLAEGAELPAAARAADLLHSGLRGKALLLEAPPAQSARVAFVGERLAELCGLVAGPLLQALRRADVVGEQLVALAEKAILVAAPCHFESGSGSAVDVDNSQAGNRDSNLQLLMRAVALPFARPAALGGGVSAAGSAVVVVSWRKLLSREETRALHRELKAAMDWMQNQTSKG